jgi:hypothetical protein
MATIYKRIHALHAKEYWISRDRCNDNTFGLIHWDNIAHALKEIPRQRRVFISKHSVGMCGVGKFMKRWKEWDTDACPRCG